MTDPAPALLLDTCAIINLSYCASVAAVFRNRYQGNAGWVRPTQAELVRQRSLRPPHPQAGRAGNWAATWLGVPIEVMDENLPVATESIQRAIAAGSTDSAFDHLGEAAGIALLQSRGTGRLVSDDHAARAESRSRGAAESGPCQRLALSPTCSPLKTAASTAPWPTPTLRFFRLESGCTHISSRSTCWPTTSDPGSRPGGYRHGCGHRPRPACAGWSGSSST